MTLDRPLRLVLGWILWLYQQVWYHWFASILLGFWDTFFGIIYRIQGRLFHIGLWKDWQNRPSPPYPIPMTKHDIPVQPERSDAAGQYIATMVATYADADELQKDLPSGAKLDPAHIHNGKHAVIYMFGYTQNLRRVWNPLPGIDYMEFAVGIPSIRITGQKGYDFPFFYLPTLYLSRLYPVVMGWMVGYRKHWGWVYGEDKTYFINRLGGKKVLSASFEVGDLRPLIMGGPKAVDWRKLLNQPQANGFGPEQFLYLHYHWDWKDALLQPVSADVQVFEALPGLQPGKYHYEPLNLGEWKDGMLPSGGFRLCAPFELLSPFSSQVLANFHMKVPSAAP